MLYPIEKLPITVITHIANFLDYRSLGSFNRVATFFKTNTSQTLIEQHQKLIQKLLSDLIEPSYSEHPSELIEKDINFLIANDKKLETFSALVKVYNRSQHESMEALITKFDKILLKYFKIAGFYCIQFAYYCYGEGVLKGNSTEGLTVASLCLSKVANEKIDDENLHLLYEYECGKRSQEDSLNSYEDYPSDKEESQSSVNSYEGFLSKIDEKIMVITPVFTPKRMEEIIEKATSVLKKLYYLQEPSFTLDKAIVPKSA